MPIFSFFFNSFIFCDMKNVFHFCFGNCLLFIKCIFRFCAYFSVYALGLFMFFGVNFAQASSYNASGKALVCITQITSHPSLDLVRQGVMDVLSESGYGEASNAHILYENAQGNMATAAQIAQKFASKKPDVIIAIATPSAQTVQKATQREATPIVFASITDPITAGLVEDLRLPKGRITGTRNITPFDRHLDLIKNVLDHVESIGVVINFAEANSIDLLEDLKQEAKAHGIAVVVTPVNNTGEVSGAMRKLVGKVDAVLLLQDNTVASALPGLLKVANEYRVPVFSTYVEAVEKGALMGLAADEYDIGRQTGRMVVAILQGQDPGSMPIEDPDKMTFLVNEKTLKSLKLTFKPDLIKGDHFVDP